MTVRIELERNWGAAVVRCDRGVQNLKAARAAEPGPLMVGTQPLQFWVLATSRLVRAQSHQDVFFYFWIGSTDAFRERTI